MSIFGRGDRDVGGGDDVCGDRAEELRGRVGREDPAGGWGGSGRTGPCAGVFGSGGGWRGIGKQPDDAGVLVRISAFAAIFPWVAGNGADGGWAIFIHYGQHVRRQRRPSRRNELRRCDRSRESESERASPLIGGQRANRLAWPVGALRRG